MSHLTHMFHAEVKQGEVLPSYLSSHTDNKCCTLFTTLLFAFLCFVLVISLFKMVLKRGTEVQSSVSKFSKKAMMCLTEKILY